MTTVFLDSNALVADYRLRSAAMRVLLRRSRDGLDRVLVPNIVISEVARSYEREYRSAMSSLAKDFQRLQRLRTDLEDFGLEEDLAALEDSDDYEGWLIEALATNNVDICLPPADVINELVRRATLRLPPFDEKGNGFRDATVWLTLLRHLNEHPPYDASAFISDDRKAFWSENGLKSALTADLVANGFAPGHLTLFDTVTRFVTSRVTDDPIVHIEVAELIEDEFDQIRTNLEVMLAGTSLDIYGAFGEAVVTGLVGEPQIAVNTVGASQVEHDYLVTMTLEASLLMDVDGYDPHNELYLQGEWVIERLIPLSGIWRADQHELDNLSVGMIDDLHPEEVLGL